MIKLNVNQLLTLIALGGMAYLIYKQKGQPTAKKGGGGGGGGGGGSRSSKSSESSESETTSSGGGGNTGGTYGKLPNEAEQIHTKMPSYGGGTSVSSGTTLVTKNPQVSPVPSAPAIPQTHISAQAKFSGGDEVMFYDFNTNDDGLDVDY